jgi:hypothetical protein
MKRLSEIYRAMSTEGLRDEREACLFLAAPDAPCSDRVREFHADLADRISDEIDRREQSGDAR